jgi:hypothetical protein
MGKRKELASDTIYQAPFAPGQEVVALINENLA